MNTRLVLSLALVAAGCTVGGDDPGEGRAAPATDAGGDVYSGRDDTAAASTAPSEAPLVEGTWAQLLFYASVNDIPAVGQTNGSVTTIQRTTITRDDTQLSMEVEPCAIEIDNGTPVVSTIVPDAFVNSLGISSRTGTLVREDGNWTFVQDPNLQLRGVKLNDAVNEPLPTTGADTRVWDQDKDGNPGVTVRITGITDGEVYLVQRDKHSLAGLVTGDRIDGLADWMIEQVVLGSDNPILEEQTSAVKNPDERASYFLSTRIETAEDCKTIVAERDVLFAR